MVGTINIRVFHPLFNAHAWRTLELRVHKSLFFVKEATLRVSFYSEVELAWSLQTLGYETDEV
jgi:hypothetical protein